jgi:hypothetical protein
MDSCNCDNWSSIYFTQLFQTLGQLTGIILSGTVAVPVVSYYSQGLRRLYNNFVKQD